MHCLDSLLLLEHGNGYVVQAPIIICWIEKNKAAAREFWENLKRKKLTIYSYPMEEVASGQRQLICSLCQRCICAKRVKSWNFPTFLTMECRPFPFFRYIRDSKYYHGLSYRTLRTFLQFVLKIFILRTKHLCTRTKPLRLLLVYFLIGTAFALPKLCSGTILYDNATFDFIC